MDTAPSAMTRLFSGKRITLLVTDSGLGGLSVFSRIAARLKREPIFSSASLIYYNAWPEPHGGYNALKDMDTRIRVFDSALEGMKRYAPDMILIACNTLSVLYDRTAFYRREAIPVIDIVRFGVDMVYERLWRDPEVTALLLGTVTTIASDRHRMQLIDRGIPAHRIVVQACDQLATQIEKGPKSDAVVQLVDGCMDAAAEKLGRIRTGVAVALCCTHFGYSREVIRKRLQQRIPGKVTVLDPNRRMADWIFQMAPPRRHGSADVTLRVVSKILWNEERIRAVSNLIEPRSAETADALRNYQWTPDLF